MVLTRSGYLFIYVHIWCEIKSTKANTPLTSDNSSQSIQHNAIAV